MTLTERLEKLCLCVGGAGEESEVAGVIRDMLGEYGAAQTDSLGNLFLTLGEGEKHLLLDAHMDQISMAVTAVTDDGFLRIAPCGGVDRRILLGQRVTVRGMTGIVCSVPPHLQKASSDKAPPIEDMAVDLCLPGDRVRESVSLGDRLYYAPSFIPLLHDRVAATSLDNRAGVAAVLGALGFIDTKKLNCKLTLLFSTREETGEQGAKVSGYAHAPDEALVVDTSFARAPGISKTKAGALEKGVMVGFAASLDRRMSEGLTRICEEEDIPVQREIMGGTTGTNADVIGVARGGVPSCTVSFPIRNMHTPVELVSMGDVEATSRLLAHYVMRGGVGGGFVTK